MILYRLAWLLIAAVGRTYWRLTIEGRENIPRVGPFVLAPVHRSFLDFAIVSGVTRRRMRYMGKAELWRSKLVGRIFSAMGAFPVHRGGADREALRRSVELLEGGEPLVLFPEGTRRSGPVVHQLFDGAAYVAIKAGVPIIPVGIGGSESALQKGKRLPRPVKIHVVVGEPRLPPSDGGTASRKAVRRLTDELEADIQRLFDEAQVDAGIEVDGRG